MLKGQNIISREKILKKRAIRNEVGKLLGELKSPSKLAIEVARLLECMDKAYWMYKKDAKHKAALDATAVRFGVAQAAYDIAAEREHLKNRTVHTIFVNI